MYICATETQAKPTSDVNTRTCLRLYDVHAFAGRICTCMHMQAELLHRICKSVYAYIRMNA